MSLTTEERRRAQHVMPYLLAAYDEERRVADSAFGKAEQYLQASRVCDEMRQATEADRDRLARENERLREVADAAERAVILEYDRRRGPAENTEIEKRARRLREALKALAAPGERERQE